MLGAHDIDQATVSICHHRRAAELRFHRYQPKALFTRRNRQCACPLIQWDQRGLRQGTVPSHALGEAKTGGVRHQRLALWSVADDVEHGGVTGVLRVVRTHCRRDHCVEQIGEALLRVQPAYEQNPAARRGGCR